MYAMPAMPLQPFPQAPPPQPAIRPVQPQQPLAWAPAPVKARGVAAEQPHFVLPPPEALGVTSKVTLPPVSTDWNEIQARLARLGVLRYRKDAVPAGGVRVTLLLPTNDPARGQPVSAQGDTEAAAVLLALEYAEAARR